MVVRMRSNSSHTGHRRSHHALEQSHFSVCTNCKASFIPHTVCKNCGMYNGRQVLDVKVKLEKKEKKLKEKQAAGAK